MFRKILFLAVAVLSLAMVAGAGAKTTTVTITKSGYVPSSVTIAQGDVVSFMNSDTIVHQVTFKSTTGVTCTPNPLVVQPNTTGNCTFANAGSFSYSDPKAKGGAFRGTVVVTGNAPSLSMVTKSISMYGATSPLSGVLSTQTVGDVVDVLAQQCGASAATKLSTVQTTTGGAYATSVKPLMNTAYTAKTKSLSSITINVRVRPTIKLTKVAPHSFVVRVAAGSTLAGRYASFQRYNGTLHRWVALRTVQLRTSSAGIAPTVVSSRWFRSSVHSGLRVRATLPQAQVGGCYAPGTSNSILS